MNANQYNNILSLASIKEVKDVNKVKQAIEDNNDKNDKEEKEEKQDNNLSFEQSINRLKALSAQRDIGDLSSRESLREGLSARDQEKESLDSSQWREGLCAGFAKDHWARFRCQYFTQETGRGIEHKIKLMIRAEDNKYIELMSNVGRHYDFPKGLESLINANDPWYSSILHEINNKNAKSGKFYIANTKANAKENRNTTPQPYTAVTVLPKDKGAYEVNIWLWNSHWQLMLTDSFLTPKQKKANMLAKTEWFNENSKINTKSVSALDILGWKNNNEGEENGV